MMIEVAGKNTRQVTKPVRGLPHPCAAQQERAFDLIAEIEVANFVEFDRVLSTVRSIDGVARSETGLLLAPA